MLFLTFGLDATNNWISIDSVKRGKTALVCPFCKNQLIARKGSMKTHHFAHSGETCAESSQAIKASLLPTFDHFELLDKDERKYIERRAMYEHRDIYSWQNKESAIQSLAEKGLITVTQVRHSKALLSAIDKIKAIDKSLVSGNKFSDKFYGIIGALSELKIHSELLEILNKYHDVRTFDTEINQSYFSNQLDRQWTIKQFEQSQKFWLDCHYKKVRALNDEYLPLLQAKIDALNQQNLYLYQFNAVMNDGSQDKKMIQLCKIGMTTRTAKERLKEVELELAKYCTIKSSEVLAFAERLGRVERILHRHYSQYQFKIGSMTEFFSFEQRIIDALLLQFQELDCADYVPLYEKPKKRGRKYLTKSDLIMNHLAVVDLLKSGKGIRETSRIAQVAINTVRKVNDALKA